VSAKEDTRLKESIESLLDLILKKNLFAKDNFAPDNKATGGSPTEKS